MEGRLYLRLLTRHWLPIVLIIASSVTVGLLSYVSTPSSHESRLSFIVQANSDSTSPAERYSGELLAQTRAQEYGLFLPGPALATLVSDRLGGDPTPERVEEDVTSLVGGTSVVLEISVRDASTAVAQDIARVLADELPRYATSIEASPTAPATTLRLLSPPSPAARVAPTMLSSVGLALLGGLVLAFVVAVVRELTNRRIRDLDDVRAVVGPAPVRVDVRAPGRGQHEPSSDGALVPLSVLIASAAARRQPVAVVPVSSNPSGPRWVLALARQLSSSGERIGLVDADLEGRHVSSATPGERLTRHPTADDVVSGDAHAGGSVEIVGAEVVAAMAGGGAAADSADPFAADLLGAAVTKVVAEVSERADIVLVMTGTVLMRSRPVFLSTREAAVIVLVERGRTRKEELLTAVEVIRKLGSEVGAVVLIGAPSRLRLR
jgi:capsular polysaccharide biosynthesis protein